MPMGVAVTAKGDAMSTVRKVNALLAKAGRAERLVRSLQGYYYVSGVGVSSGLYYYCLADADLPRAIEHIEDVLTAELGVPFVLTRGDSK